MIVPISSLVARNVFPIFYLFFYGKECLNILFSSIERGINRGDNRMMVSEYDTTLDKSV
jgi:hypothetical protein